MMAAAMVARSGAGAAQNPPRKFVIATLSTGAEVPDKSPLGAGLIDGLARRGYVVDRNYTLVRRGAQLQLDRLPGMIAEFVQQHADVIVTFGYATARAAKELCTLPVVSFTAGDPVGTGLVDGLARPGGHLTGISDVSAEVTPKRLELLRDFAPKLRTVAVLYNASDPGMVLRYKAAEAVAGPAGISVRPFGVREPADFGSAFDEMNRDLPDAILMVSDVLTNLNRGLVFEFAAAHRLPAIYENDGYVRDGGLMSYGPDIKESLDRVASLVDRILKGARPADLPFEQPTLFRFAINLQTAKALGLAVPQVILTQADEIVE
jgi:putative ABC transport system substrate-binding protein